MSINSVLGASLVSAIVLAGAAANAANPGKDQIAAQLGVNGDQFSTAQLLRLDEAKAKGDLETVNFILSKAGTEVNKSSSGNSSNPGYAQLEALAGVSNSGLSSAELIRLADAKAEGDHLTANFILSGAAN